jgi:hypothetical protein
LLLVAVLVITLGATGINVTSEEGVSIAAVGDIASCNVGTDEEVATQVEEMLPDALLNLGDTVYPRGSAAKLRNCYDPAWGRFKDITKPTMGNHDFTDPSVGEPNFMGKVDASAYLDYFGVDNYYSYDLGAWHLISLNSNCYVVECGPGSEQFEWLREDLGATDAECVLAYWHHPAYEVGGHEDMYKMRPMLRMLYREGADVVLNGHDHIFDRRTRVNAFDSPDPNGLRQFVVGTGAGVTTTSEKTRTRRCKRPPSGRSK